MTSSDYAEKETWNPLAPKIRKWESDVPATISTSTSVTSQPRQRYEKIQEGDFAPEVAFESDARVHNLKERPSAPRLKEDHIWGVRDDWGPKAGAWGRGTKVHQKDRGSEDDDHGAVAAAKR